MIDVHAEAWPQKGTMVIAKIRAGDLLLDADFDSMYSPLIRSLSGTHWTPVEVAVKAAKILINGGAKRILDVGCGPGKFCLIAAGLGDARVFGVDRRAQLLTEAEFVTKSCGLSNLEFIHSDMTDIDWSQYDGFYMYNPFMENVCNSAAIDHSVRLHQNQYYEFVDVVTKKLNNLPIGARIVTYHGFGGDFPEGYKLEYNRFVGSGSLEYWVKTSESSTRSDEKYESQKILE